MTLKKLLLVVRRRWWALLALALIGLIAGATLSAIRNRGIETLFKAEASVVLIRQDDDDSGRQIRSQLDEFQRNAFRVNQSTLEQGTAEITTIEGETEGFLVFVGYGSTDRTASVLATSMRSNYLETAPTGVQAVELDLADLAVTIDAIRTDVAELTAQDEVDPDVELSASFLAAAISQLQGQAVQLAGDLILFDLQEEVVGEAADIEEVVGEPADIEEVVGEPADIEEVVGEPADIEAELEIVQSAMLDLQNQLDRLDLEPAVETERDLRIMALTQQEGILTQQYVELFLNQAETASLTSVGTVTIRDVSETPLSSSVAGVGGMFLSLLIALTGIFAYDFFRRPIWSAADLGSFPTLGTLAPRSRDMGRHNSPWYMDAPLDQRLSDVQQIRASLEGFFVDGPTTVGFTQVGVPADDAKIAAADVAASLAAVGTSVLLVDAEFGSVSGLPEFGPMNPTLSDLLQAPSGQAVSRSFVKSTLAELTQLMPGLAGMSAGTWEGYPTDALGGPAFRMVLEESREVADVVIIVAPRSSGPASLILAQRLDVMVLVARAESTRLTEVEAAVEILESQRASFAGVLLLDHSRRGIGTLVRTGRRRRHL